MRETWRTTETCRMSQAALTRLARFFANMQAQCLTLASWLPVGLEASWLADRRLGLDWLLGKVDLTRSTLREFGGFFKGVLGMGGP